jgi:hypothetical protein
VKSAEVVEKVKQNAHDVWQLIYLTIRSLHLRNGSLDDDTPLLPDYLSSTTEHEIVELGKEALYTASVLLPSPYTLRPR